MILYPIGYTFQLGWEETDDALKGALKGYRRYIAGISGPGRKGIGAA